MKLTHALMVRSARTGGFTIIEVLVVVAIIAVLIALVVPTMEQAKIYARYTRWRGFSKNLRADPTMVTYFTFEEGSGTTMTNLAAGDLGLGDRRVEDSITPDGTLTGGAWTSKRGRWVRYKDTMLLPSGNQINIPISKATKSLTGDITVEAWIKPMAPTAAFYSFSAFRYNFDLTPLGLGAIGTNISLLGTAAHPTQGSGGNAMIYDSTGTLKSLWNTNKVAASNDWGHYVFVRRGANTFYYVNGVSQANTTAFFTIGGADRLVIPFVSSINIGNAAAGAGDAYIDEFAIYRRGLDPGEAKGHYEMGRP